MLRQLALEQPGHGNAGHGGFWRALFSPRVLLLALGYYGLANLNGAISTFLPQSCASWMA